MVWLCHQFGIATVDGVVAVFRFYSAFLPIGLSLVHGGEEEAGLESAFGSFPAS
jgi:hypothetical protein